MQRRFDKQTGQRLPIMMLNVWSDDVTLGGNSRNKVEAVTACWGTGLPCIAAC